MIRHLLRVARCRLTHPDPRLVPWNGLCGKCWRRIDGSWLRAEIDTDLAP